MLEALEAEIPTKTAYVAEGAERDDRLRDILKLAADRSLPLLEVTRVELDRLTGGAVHQGVALQLPAFDYAHPDDLLAAGPRLRHPAADRGPRLDHRPAQPGRDHPLGRRLRRPRGADPRAPLGRHDRRRLEDLGRRRGPVPIARATNLTRTLKPYADAGLFLVGLDGRAPRDIADVAESSGPLVLVVGSEGDGLSRLVRETCDTVAAIPMADDVESLNAGVAAGIALYEISRPAPVPERGRWVESRTAL